MKAELNSSARFSNRVANYVQFRPNYPPAVLGLFRDEMGLTQDSVIADVGSGTGISARVFLENGNKVFGVEPNVAMRAAAEEFLSAFPNFLSREGTAENTGLENESIDFVVAAQAFHWFDAEKTRIEFSRILRSGGNIALIWNERQLASTPFLRDYEQFLLKFANDYMKVRHDNVNEKLLNTLFEKDFRRSVFSNSQVLDFDGLLGRVLSASYMPSESDKRFPQMKNELQTLVAKHGENGNIELLYDTTIYYTQI